MQLYYFYRHSTEQYIFLSHERLVDHGLLFLWVDSLRHDVIHRSQDWHEEIKSLTELDINEFHIRDILNIDHPCAFETTEDYDALIFRKIVTPDDTIETTQNYAERRESLFGLSTTPVSLIISPAVLVSVREEGNQAVARYVNRFKEALEHSLTDQNKPRKLPVSPIDLSLRILSSVIDCYPDIRMPLTQRVEYWQLELLQGRQRFKQWPQLFQEHMTFQQIENLCEEQIESLQALRDELVENYRHLLPDSRADETPGLILVRMNDLISHIERIQKHSSRLGRAIQSAIDLHFNAISNQTNENMRFLAIITAVFAPLTLLTGIYGMNFVYIPGLKSPLGFWAMLIVMLVSSIALIYYFYQRQMLGRSKVSVMDLLAQQKRQHNLSLMGIFNHGQNLKTQDKPPSPNS